MQNLNLVLRHYNRIKPINCTVISGDINKLFTVKLSDNENNAAVMIKGDPVLIGVLKGEDFIQINGGSVVGATPKEDKYIICSNDVINISEGMDKREFERYPTSLLGDIKLENTSKREAACIKDISYMGMCIYSTGDFNIKDVVEVTIYLSSSVSRYDGTVLRKTKNFGRDEYAIQIIHRDKIAMDSTKSQLFSFVQSEKEIMLRHLLSSTYKI